VGRNLLIKILTSGLVWFGLVWFGLVWFGFESLVSVIHVILELNE
jgi:hypothetical protein